MQAKGLIAAGSFTIFALCGCGHAQNTTPPLILQQIQRTGASNLVPYIREFSKGLPPKHSPFFIARAPDGSMWFDEHINYGRVFVVRIDADGTTKSFQYTNDALNSPAIYGMAFGPDGNLWMSDAGDGVIAKMTREGKVTSFRLHPGAIPFGMTVGSDKNLWFVDSGGNSVDRITTGGRITTFTKGISLHASLGGIASGPDGNLWFTEFRANRIGRITPGGAVTEFSKGLSPNASLTPITPGSDALWFTEANAIGRITTSGSISEFSKGISNNETPVRIAAGADGALWFTEHGRYSMLARITTQGVIKEYRQGISPNSYPAGIAAGTGRTMWFCEAYANKVAEALF